MVGGEVTLFAEVTADPCPTIRWRVNGSAVRSGENYQIENPCSNVPAGTTSFNFTLTIAATVTTTGTYNATLTNPAGTIVVPYVFVTPPGMSSMLALQCNTDILLLKIFGAVPATVAKLSLSSGPNWLLNGTSVDMQCVNSGLPRPEITFFQGTEQITPGQGRFTRFEQVSFDTVRLSEVQEEDSGNYVCEARREGVVLNRSLHGKLLVCSKC